MLELVHITCPRRRGIGIESAGKILQPCTEETVDFECQWKSDGADQRHVDLDILMFKRSHHRKEQGPPDVEFSYLQGLLEYPVHRPQVAASFQELPESKVADVLADPSCILHQLWREEPSDKISQRESVISFIKFPGKTVRCRFLITLSGNFRRQNRHPKHSENQGDMKI